MTSDPIENIVMALHDMDDHNKREYAKDLLAKAQRKANRLQKIVHVCWDDNRFYINEIADTH